MIFGTRLKRKKEKYAIESELPAWNDVVVWKDFRSPYISEVVWAKYIQHVTSVHFMQRSQSDAENRHRHVHEFVTTHTDYSMLFFFACKADDKICFFFFYILSFIFFINIFNWQYFYLAGSLGSEPSPIKLFCWNACVEWWPLKRDVAVHR